jgi:hypothetical protein
VVALVLLVVVAGPLGLGRQAVTKREQPAEADQHEVNVPQRRVDPPMPTARSVPRAAEATAPIESAQPLPEPIASPEEERREVAKEEADFLRQTQDEPVDARWATSAQAKLGAQLMAMGNAHGFRVDRTECHTTRCLGVVTFPDRSNAKKNIGGILHASYEPNCGVSILLPEAEAGKELQTNVRFDCEESRIAEALKTR